MTIQDLKDQIMSAPEQFKTRPHIWHRYLSMIEADDVCLEFGIWKGSSINYMAKVRPDSHFHGFDSFEGLPEDWVPSCPKGRFSCDPSALRFENNVQIHPGLFDQTLPAWLANHATDRLKAVHIDCDLGSSAACVLHLLQDHLLQQSPVLLFDEFYNYKGFEEHEFRAFFEFIERTGCEFKVLGRNILNQQVLIQLMP